MSSKKQAEDGNPTKHGDTGPAPFTDIDYDLAVASHDLDAAADYEWFENHPGETEFVRSPSALETTSLHLRPGTMVYVVRTPAGTQGRVFFHPEESTD